MIRFRSARRSPWLAAAGFALLATAAAAPATVQGADTKPARARSSGDSLIFLQGGNSSTMMHGSMSDLREARALRSAGEPLLYVRRDGRAYVIRDAAVLRQAEAILKPQADLGARQGELGSRQGELGSEQGKLGERQAALALRHVSGGRSEDAARQQEELGRRQEALGRQQEALGRQQERLGRQVQAKLRALVDDALRRGLAREVG